MSRFLNAKYQSLEAYVPGEQPQDQKYIKLNTNESPYPPGDAVAAAVNRAAVERLRLYGDPDAKVLSEKLAARYNVAVENVYTSNGSDDILNFAFMAFGAKGAAFSDITYGFYKVFSDLYGIKAQIIPLKDDFSLDYHDYLNLNKLIVIANPNAPTGLALSLGEIEEILKANPDGVVVIDEAYVDFGGQSAVGLIKKYPNLLVVQTYSKSRSLAGARLGYCFGDKELIDDLKRIKYSTNPYNVNSLTQAAGAAALDEEEYYQANCAKICETREKTAQALKEMGFTMTESKTNFLFIKKDGLDGTYLYQELKKRGVLVRHLSGARIKEYNRVTIGTAEEMAVFLAKVREIIGG